VSDQHSRFTVSFPIFLLQQDRSNKYLLDLPFGFKIMPQLLSKEIGSTGFGLMGLTWRQNPVSEEQAIKTMKAALNAGCNFWNGGVFYGSPEYNSLHILVRYFDKYPEDAAKVVLSIKGGALNGHPCGTPEFLESEIKSCLKLLNGKKSIDIYEMARVDRGTPLEVSLKALEGQVKEGRIGGIGLSECSAATIRRAAGITKIVAVEVELSLWSTDILSNGVAAACAEHNIPVVAYSPLGRGMLTGQLKSLDDLPETDMRRHFPRFQPDVFDLNLDLVRELEKVAKKKGCTAPQLAISWTKHCTANGSPEIIPIPGATTEERVQENAVDVTLDRDDLAEINAILSKVKVVGARYPEPLMAHAEG